MVHSFIVRLRDSVAFRHDPIRGESASSNNVSAVVEGSGWPVLSGLRPPVW
jgi:hypothetical protein